MKAKELPDSPLSTAQTGWLAAVLLCAQVPLWGDVLPWVAIVGTGLAIVRLVPALNAPAYIRPPLWRRWMLPVLAVAAAVGIRAQLGYFLARDPCVQFLFVLVGIKFLEARSTRDGTLFDLPRDVFGDHAVFLCADDLRGTHCAAVAVRARRGTGGAARATSPAGARSAPSSLRPVA